MQKVLVTGGAGFIGSCLVKKLLEFGYYDVDVVDNLSSGSLDNLSDLNFRCVAAGLLPIYEQNQEHDDDADVLVIAGDFVDPCVLDRIDRVSYDVVFHLAANPRVEFSVDHPTLTTEENVYKTVALFEACQKSSVRRVVFSSSSSVYGEVELLPTTETTQGIVQSPYGLQKKVCEQFADMFYRLYGTDIVSLRYFNVYGPGQLGDSAYATAISAWCNALHAGQPLRSDGDGTQTRDMVFVEDVAYANILAAEAPVPSVAGKCFNIATGTAISNNDILDLFTENFGDTIKIKNAPERPGDVKHTLASTKRAEESLGFRAKTSFHEGLQKTWDWWVDVVDKEREDA